MRCVIYVLHEIKFKEEFSPPKPKKFKVELCFDVSVPTLYNYHYSLIGSFGLNLFLLKLKIL